ncbi:YDG domain-containing protein [Asticcacaulis solisilvae]|uniref:YDG domain-containing protein n=1 Tax=Asticcacaulis solisilvae TaxID=1217274 RepID=UPI003FD722A2
MVRQDQTRARRNGTHAGAGRLKALRWPLFGLSLLSIVPGGMAQAQAVSAALPSGGQVVAGQAAIGTQGNTTTITQSSDKAILTWTDFSIGKDGIVNFNNGTGATLNRVTGGNRSSIDGLLNATGSVYLINPNGVIVGKTGVINVGGSFVASALDISNENFLNGGDQTFAGDSLASVVNLGKIGALGGDVSLMAVDVRNDGTIGAANGTAGLLAGRTIILRDTQVDDGRFLVVTGGSDTSVTNTGAVTAAAAELRAQGGNIYALAGNTQGVISATGVKGKGGKIWLTAGEGGKVQVSGSTLAAADAAGNGGAISVTGQTIDVAADATLDASATSANGAGGTLSVIAGKASGSLGFAGTAFARGGFATGNGGTVETSGAAVGFTGARIDTSATGGKTGNWLIDPFDLTVDSAAAATISTNLATSNVTLQTTASGTSGPGTQSSGDGDIVINSGISWSSANTLTLDAYHAIAINAPLTVSGAGGVVLTTNDGGTGGDYGFGLQADGFHGAIDYTGSGGSLIINSQPYTLLYSMSDLQGISGGSGQYALAKSLDASGTTYTDAVVGVLYGTLTGLGHRVDALTIDAAGDTIGLVGQLQGNLRDIGVAGGSVRGGSQVGGLVGVEYSGSIDNAYASLAVTGSGSRVGGLIGYASSGTVTNAFATGAVTGSFYVGGLAGYLNFSTIGTVFATGHVDGNGTVGGLVGTNVSSTISDAYATGSAWSASTAGGLVGSNVGGTIINAYATGYASAPTSGGLTGSDSGSVTTSYFDRDTTGLTGAGALTTAQLQSGSLPTGFGSGTWATGPGLYPYLKTFFPNGVQAVTGTATDAAGSNAAGGTAAAYANGGQLGNSGVGANGYYYIATSAGTVGTTGGLGAALTVNGASNASGVVYDESRSLSGGNVTGLDVQSGKVAVTTGASSLTALDATFGGAWAGILSNVGPADYSLTATGAFTVDAALNGGAVSVTSGGDLTIAAAVTAGSGKALTLDAHDTLDIEAAVTASGGNAVTLTYAHGGSGDYGFGLQSDGFHGSLDFSGTTGNTLTINGTAYTLLYSLSDLSGISGVTGTYALARTLDASGTTYTTAPVDSLDGTLTGLGHTVDNLSVVTSGYDLAGLFNHAAGALRDIGVKGGSISGHWGMTGGLVASSTADLTNVYATADVSSDSGFLGGLAGYSQGALTNAFATGNVKGNNGTYVGGLVGLDYGPMRNTFATGSVSGYSTVGGLAGSVVDTTVDDAYATGSVTGSYYAGGLVGWNYGGTIRTAYATGFVNAGTQYSSNGAFVAYDMGGAYGDVYYNSDTSGRSDSYATGLTTAQLQSGSLPSGFGAGAWSAGSGLYPYLKVFFPNGAQAISGTATDASAADAVGGSVTVYADGGQLGTSGVGANGYYYVATNAGTVGAATGLGGTVTLKGDAQASGAVYTDSRTLSGGNAAGFDIQAGRVAVTTGASAYSDVEAGIATAFGGANWAGLLSTIGNPDYTLTATGAFTVDDDLPALGAVTVKSGGDLTVSHPLTLAGSNALTLDAQDNLAIDATVTAAGGNAVTLIYADGGSGDYGFGLQQDGFHGRLDFTGTGGSLTINGAAYTLLYSLSDLAGASANSGNFALARTLDASGATYTDSVIGSVQGTLTGLGHTVDNLTINSTSDNVGLAGFNYGVLRDIGVRGGSISGGNTVGGLVGQNYYSTLRNVYSTASVSGGNDVGGLVGFAWGSTVTNVHAGGTVGGSTRVGGLIGFNQYTGVQNAYATGNTGSSGDDSGGLIGYNDNATIVDVYATGSTRGNNSVGGLIGYSLGGAYYNVYATGSVTGGAYVGGLLGTSFGGVYFEDAFATGYVRGQYTGGLVGISLSYTPTLVNTYYIPDTTGQCCTANGFGGGTPVTTAQLQGSLPSGFNPADWGTGAGLYPYLKVLFPNGVQAVSGTAYADTSGTAASGGAVRLYTGGNTLATASAGANGYYYVALPTGTIGASSGLGGALTLDGDANASGVSYSDTHSLSGGAVSGFDITAGQINITTGATTDSSLQTALAATFGSAAWTAVLANIGNPDYTLTATGDFTLDDGLTGTGAVTIKSGGDLTVSHDLTAGSLLTLDAHDNLAIDATVTAAGNTAVTLAYADGGSGDYGFGLTQTGFTGRLDFTGSGGSLVINGNPYTLLYSLGDLQAIDSVSGHYALANSLDASSAGTYGGSLVGTLDGTLTGLGHTIGNVTIAAPSIDEVGVFGGLASGGTLRDIGATHVDVTGHSGVGGLLGFSNVAELRHVYATGSVSGNDTVGGLVGANISGVIDDAHADAAVTSVSSSGGLAGNSSGTISNAYATGAVRTGPLGTAGGLIANQYAGVLDTVFATGSVTTGDMGVAGGLVGAMTGGGTIDTAYATGSVTGGQDSAAGGLVGYAAGLTIRNVYVTGYVHSAHRSGGLIALDNGYTNTFTNAYYNSETTGQSDSNGTALTTADLQSGSLPTGFDATVWGTGTNLYPYLKTVFPNGIQAISGTAGDASNRPLAGANVTLYSGGNAFATTNSGANGYYYVVELPGTVTTTSPLGATVTADGAGSVGGVTFSDSRTICGCNVIGVDIHSGVIGITSGAASWSGLQTQLGTVFGGATWSGIQSNLGTATTLLGLENPFTFDQALNIDGALFVADAGGAVTLDHDITASDAVLFYSPVTLGADVSLTGTATGVGFAGTVDGAHALTLSGASVGFGGAVGGTSALTSLSATATGGLVSVGGQVNTTGAIRFFANGAFVNTAGASALNAGGGFIVYTQSATDPTGTMPANSFDGLTATNYYNDAYDFGTGAFASAVPAGNHFVYAYAASVTPVLTGTAEKTYDAGTAADTTHLTAGPGSLLDVNDSVNLVITGAAYGDGNAGSGKSVTADVTLGSNPNNYTLASSTATANVGVIDRAALTLSAVTGTKTYDTTTASSGVVGVSGLQGSDTVTGATQSYASKNVMGTGGSTLLVDAGYTVNDGNGGGNYTVATQSASGTITRAALTLSAVSDTKTYDATAASSGTVGVSGLLGSDTVTGAAQAFDSKNAGARTLSVTGYTVDDGNGGGNYAVTTVTAAGSIARAALTLTAVTDTKTYDATTASSGTVAVSGLLGSDTVTGATQAFDSRNAGTRTLAVDSGYAVNDGNGGANYTVTTQTASGAIARAALTLSAVSDTKTYDATTASSGTVGVSGLQGADTVTGTAQAFDSRNAGTRTLSVNGGYTVNDGNGGANYTVTMQTASGAIDKAALTLSAASDSKTYDATTASAGTVGVSGLKGSDTVTGATQAFASKTVLGTGGSTLGVSGYTVNDGNNGGNYTVTTQSAAGTISQATLTLAAVTYNKTYDATASAGGTVAVSGLKGTDTVTGATEAYDSRNAGTRTLSVTGYTVNDGNGGGNYAVTTQTATGAIAKAALTLAAVSDTRTYDATMASTGTVDVSGLKGSDTVTGATQAFDSRNAGARTLSVNSGYAVNDGNGGGNYTVTTQTASGTIAKAALTLSAATDSKTYDATATSSGTVGVSGLKGTDTVTGATQAFDSRNAGTRTLGVTAYTVNDGNGGGNYAVTTQTAAGTIAKAALTLSAVTDTKTYDATAASSGVVGISGLKGSDTVTAAQAFDSRNAGARTLSVNGYTVNDGNSGGNYAVTTQTAPGAIDARAITVTADNAGKFDGTADPALTYGITSGSLQGNDGLTGSLARVSGELPGTYAIGQGSLSASSNYAVTFTGATFTITASARQNQVTVNPVQNGGTSPAGVFQPSGQDGGAGGTGGTGGSSGGSSGGASGAPAGGAGPAGGATPTVPDCRGQDGACLNKPYPGNNTFSSYISFLGQ